MGTSRGTCPDPRTKDALHHERGGGGVMPRLITHGDADAESGCLQLLEILEILEISWNLKFLLEILEISWIFVDAPGKLYNQQCNFFGWMAQ